jgi:hypothetical protein
MFGLKDQELVWLHEIKLVHDKHSSLLCRSVSDEKKKVVLRCRNLVVVELPLELTDGLR